MVVMKNKEDDENKNLVYGLKLSSAVPGKVTGENKSHELTGMDLAMKLHYLKGLYFFTNNKNNNNNNNNNDIISIAELKVPMFECLVSYFKACGRVRTTLPETDGRPVIKLNDAGIRIVEARSTKTVDEWLAMDDFLSLQDQLIYHRPLGPDLAFSPLVFIQVTWFKCGGISLGLSWAHILGDVFSASTFINILGQCMQGLDHQCHQAKTLAFPDPPKPKSKSLRPDPKPRSLKQIDPVGDYWVGPTKTQMATYSFHLTSNQLDQLLLKVDGPNYGITNKKISQYCFEIISAIIWKSIAKIRKDLEPKVVTICSNPKSLNREQMIPYNNLKIGIIEVSYSILEIDLLTLVSLITDNMVDESGIIEESIEEKMGAFDYILYGANLTFVNMEEANIYGFELKGQFPIFASYTISGVGEKGVVLVLPGPNCGKNKDISDKVITVILPEDELEKLKNELNKV